MDLILWRHAEAQAFLDGDDDMARELTPRGIRQAVRMASWLKCHLPEDTRMLVSPAKRCVQTAKILGRKYKIQPEISPDATVAQLLAAAQWPHGKHPVLLVGHQPTLGQTVAELLGISSKECVVKRGAVWWLRERVREEQPRTVLVTVQSPEML